MIVSLAKQLLCSKKLATQTVIGLLQCFGTCCDELMLHASVSAFSPAEAAFAATMKPKWFHLAFHQGNIRGLFTPEHALDES